MTRCQYAKVGTCCRCDKCAGRLLTAQRLVDRGPVDLRDLEPYMRPWVLAVREERCTPIGNGSGGCAGPREEEGAGPWHENAVGDLEDWDDGIEW